MGTSRGRKAKRRERTVRRKLETKLKIDTQEVIGEVRTHTTELIRLTRVQYSGSEGAFIDLRMFRRGYHGDEEIFFPSTRGIQIPAAVFNELVSALAVKGEPPARSEIH